MKLVKCLAGIAMAAAAISSANAQSVSAQMKCKLTNTEADVALYEGACKVKQTQGSGGNTIFEIDMGKGAPFMFAGVKGQSNWMHGPEKVHFTDLPNGAIFHWDTFALVVAQ